MNGRTAFKGSELGLKLQGLSEILCILAIQQIPKNDYQFLYVILKTLRDQYPESLIYEQILCEHILEKCEKENLSFLEGRIITILGFLKIKDIDFWLTIEKLYLQQLKTEPIFKAIEAMVGFGLANRGTSDILAQI